MSILRYVLLTVPLIAACPKPEPDPTPAPAEFNYVEVPAGTFLMGCTIGQFYEAEADEQKDDATLISDCAVDEMVPNSAEPTEVDHEVTLSRGFLMAATELTQHQWRDVVGNSPNPNDCSADDCPMGNINWWEALTFANLMSERDGLAPCYELVGCSGGLGYDKSCEDVLVLTEDESVYSCEGYRLPTEAEWEYAARAAEDQLYSGSEHYEDVAWTAHNDEDLASHPVALLAPNAWGLYDMSGNLREWVWDTYKETEYSTSDEVDPIGDSNSDTQVVRGGSWNTNPDGVRVSKRYAFSPALRTYVIGLRLVRTQL